MSSASPGDEGRVNLGIAPKPNPRRTRFHVAWRKAGGSGASLLSYLLLLEVQELHGAHLAVGLAARGSFAPAAPSAAAACAAPAAIGLVAEAADPVLAGGSGPYRLRGRFNHHDLLAGPEGEEERAEAEKKTKESEIPGWHPHLRLPRAPSSPRTGSDPREVWR